jgi:type I restriction enzyme S subunit
MSREPYPLVELGRLTLESNDRIGTQSAPVLSSTKHYGLVRSDEYFKGRQIFSVSISNYKAAIRGQIVYATNHLAEGSIGIQDGCSLAAISPIYTVVTCREGVLPQYLINILRSDRLLREYWRLEQATVDRRGSIRYRDFASIRVPLPPLHDQHMMVDVLNGLDSEVQASEAAAGKLETLAGAMLADSLSVLPPRSYSAGGSGGWQPGAGGE